MRPEVKDEGRTVQFRKLGTDDQDLGHEQFDSYHRILIAIGGRSGIQGIFGAKY
jgi:hypothetical protein